MKENTSTSANPWKRWLILAFICVLLIASLAGLKYRQIQESIAFAASFPERSATVTAVTAEVGSWTQVYRTIGEIRATRFVELRNEVEGRITSIGFIGGDSVAAGKTLLQLDSR